MHSRKREKAMAGFFGKKAVFSPEKSHAGKKAVFSPKKYAGTHPPHFQIFSAGIWAGILVFIREALPIISGYGCKILCSGVFVAGRTPESVIRDDLGSFPLNLGTYTVDRADSSVTGSVLGMATRVALYRSGLGATLVSRDDRGDVERAAGGAGGMPAVRPDTIDWPMGDRVRGGDTDTGLGAAVGMAFGDGDARRTGTRAVVVVYHGQIVAERYAPGFDRHTRLTGWSMTKGITNALVGILVNEGKLNIYQPAPVETWQEDQRSRITMEELLHMESGLRWWEFYGGPSDATRMLFKEKDMGTYAIQSAVRNPPGKVFNYSSGTANILSAIIRKTVLTPTITGFLMSSYSTRPGCTALYWSPMPGVLLSDLPIVMRRRGIGRVLACCTCRTGYGTGSRSCLRGGWISPGRGILRREILMVRYGG
jgi:hypothetical protein